MQDSTSEEDKKYQELLSTIEKLKKSGFEWYYVPNPAPGGRTQLSVSRLHNLEAKDWPLLKDCLQVTRHVASLATRENKFYLRDNTTWDGFCQMLPIFTQLTALDMTENSLDELDYPHWQSLCQSIQASPLLTSLNLSGNSLGLHDFHQWSMFCPMLKALTQLNSLDLSRNLLDGVSDIVWKSFWAMVQESSHLTSLNLNYNHLFKYKDSDDRWQFTCKAIQSIPHLTSLSLMGNGLSEKHLIQLVPALQSHFNLLSLDLDDWCYEEDPTPEVIERIEHILSRNKQLLKAKSRAEALLLAIPSGQAAKEEKSKLTVQPFAKAVLQELTDAMALLSECSGSEADAYKTRLQQLHDEVAFRVASFFAICSESVEALAYYQEVSPESQYYGEARLSGFLIVLMNQFADPDNVTAKPEKRARQAFMVALPLCLNARGRLISFENLNVRDFDAFLLQAVGIPQTDLIDMIGKVSTTIRRALLQYLILIDLRESLSLATPSQAQTNFFQTEKQFGLRDKLAKLPSISTLDELMKLPIAELFAFAMQRTQELASAESTSSNSHL